MNLAHRLLCSSGRWRRAVRERILPWALEDIDLGPEPVEVGPGPGLTTDVLRTRCTRLTAVEVDPCLAARLTQRLRNTNVDVVTGDATCLPFDDGRFTGAVALTMLHHVPSHAAQNRLLAEIHRVLRPGAWFAGCDSRASVPLRLLHLFDTMVLVDPETFGSRLEAAGFRDVRVEALPTAFRFRARARARA